MSLEADLESFCRGSMDGVETLDLPYPYTEL